MQEVDRVTRRPVCAVHTHNIATALDALVLSQVGGATGPREAGTRAPPFDSL